MKRLFAVASASAALLLFDIVIVGHSNAQQPEAEAVKAADSAFYAALSAGDIAAMQKVWSADADIQNIGPRSKTVAVGWDTIKKGFEATHEAFPELKVSPDDLRIKIVGPIAWASVTERVQRKNKAGEASKGTNLATNIFQKQDGRWLMVYHHASIASQ